MSEERQISRGESFPLVVYYDDLHTFTFLFPPPLLPLSFSPPPPSSLPLSSPLSQPTLLSSWYRTVLTTTLRLSTSRFVWRLCGHVRPSWSPTFSLPLSSPLPSPSSVLRRRSWWGRSWVSCSLWGSPTKVRGGKRRNSVHWQLKLRTPSIAVYFVTLFFLPHDLFCFPFSSFVTFS